MVKRVSTAFLICVALASAQLTPNSVTVTASRNTTAQSDQVLFNIRVATPLDATRDDVLAALQGAGITLANFSGVSTEQQFIAQGQQTKILLDWYFLLPSTLATMKSTIGLLTAVQNSNAQKNGNFTISFGATAAGSTPQPQSCSIADLISDARAQAQKMAGAAGATLGGVLAVSGATSATQGQTAGLFSSSPISTLACSLTVKFGLGGI